MAERPRKGKPIPGTRLLEFARKLLTGLSEEFDLFQTGESVISSSELQALDCLICEGFKIVRRMVNAFQPINQLPPEVMEVIFSLVPDNLAATEVGSLCRRFRSHRMVDVRGLCPITAVCSQWRNMALWTSNLWSCTYDRTRNHQIHQALHDNYIDRCKGGPLHICIEGRISDTTLTLLMSSGDRVREIYVDGVNCGGVADMEKYSDIAVMPLKNIEQCTLSFIYSLPHTLNLFGGYCPKLRMLRLETVSIFPSSPIPSLTHLAILTPPPLPNILGCLLKVLDGCPELQELYLNDFAFSQPALSVGDWRCGPVRLNKLKRLFLREALYRIVPAGPDLVNHYVTSILPFLAIPASCITRIGNMRTSGLEPCLQSLAGEVRDPVTHLSIHAVRFMKKNSNYCLRAVDPTRQQYTSVDVGVFRRDFTRQPVVQQELFEPLRLALVQLPLLSRIRELYVHSERGAAWGRSLRRISIFPALPHLETLVVELHHPTCARDFLAVLEVPMAAELPAARPEVCCPGLSTIVLSSSFKDATYMRCLARTRASAGYPLDRLLLDIRRKSSTEMSEYNAQGELVRFLTEGEAENYRLLRKGAEIAPATCPTWMDEELSLS